MSVNKQTTARAFAMMAAALAIIFAAAATYELIR